tara:strand:+ start:1374 stop:1496 length:123 start_codon:yes stop_codon:yes gene_type:complete
MKKNPKPFKLNCFGILGIVLLISGTFSGFVVYYAWMEILK